MERWAGSKVPLPSGTIVTLACPLGGVYEQGGDLIVRYAGKAGIEQRGKALHQLLVNRDGQAHQLVLDSVVRKHHHNILMNASLESEIQINHSFN